MAKKLIIIRFECRVRAWKIFQIKFFLLFKIIFRGCEKFSNNIWNLLLLKIFSEHSQKCTQNSDILSMIYYNIHKQSRFKLYTFFSEMKPESKGSSDKTYIRNCRPQLHSLDVSHTWQHFFSFHFALLLWNDL